MANLAAVAPNPAKVIVDTAIRAVKTAIFTFIGIVGANVAGWTDASSLKNAGVVAIAAGASVVVNLILSWANTTV